MKFKTRSGKEVDTDKVNDLEALVYEKVLDFYNFCRQYDISLGMQIIVDAKQMACFNKMTTIKDIDQLYKYLFDEYEKATGRKIVLIQSKNK